MRSALVGLGMLSVAGVLFGPGLILLAQLLAGLALVPLSLAAYLRLLPPSPWSDGPGDGPGPGWGGDDRGGRGPSGGGEGDTDWDRFERQFRAYVEERQLAEV